MLEKNFEEKVDKEVAQELKKCFIYEDMLGYQNVFEDLKKKVLKKKYNIDYKVKEEKGCNND